MFPFLFGRAKVDYDKVIGVSERDLNKLEDTVKELEGMLFNFKSSGNNMVSNPKLNDTVERIDKMINKLVILKLRVVRAELCDDEKFNRLFKERGKRYGELTNRFSLYKRLMKELNII